jgi:hypothetical protein
MIESQTEAKRFLVEKVVRQAQVEGILLADAEQRMLSWSESDPDIVIDFDLPGRLAAEMSDEEYESKIAGLLRRSFAADVAANPDDEARWKQAAAVLHEGDHYILVMLDAAIGDRLKRWWQFWR